MQKYQGKTVSTVRAAKQGDSDFNAAKDQVVIKTEDGTEKTVARSEVTEA